MHICILINIMFSYANADNKRNVKLNLVYPNFIHPENELLDRHNLPVLSRECYDYLYMSRTFAAVFRICYVAFIRELQHSTLRSTKSETVHSYIQNNLPKIIELTRRKMWGFIKRNESHFIDYKYKFRIVFSNYTKELKTNDFVEKKDLQVLIKNEQIMLCVANIMINKVMFMGLKAILNCAINNDSIIIIDNIRNYENFVSESHNLSKNRELVNEVFIPYNKLTNFNIKTQVKKLGFGIKELINCEFNITLCVIEQIIIHVRSMRASYSHASKDSVFAFYKDNQKLCVSNVNITVTKIISNIMSYWNKYISTTKAGENIHESVILVFDSLQAFHFFKYYYNFNESDLNGIYNIFEFVCECIDVNQRFFLHLKSTEIKKITHVGGSYVKLDSLYSFYYDPIINFKQKLIRYKFDYSSSSYNHLMQMIAKTTYNAINAYNILTLTYETLRKNNITFEDVAMNLEKRIASLDYILINEILKLKDIEYMFLRYAYITLQRYVERKYLLRIIYFPPLLQLSGQQIQEVEHLKNCLNLQRIILDTKGYTEYWRDKIRHSYSIRQENSFVSYDRNEYAPQIISIKKQTLYNPKNKKRTVNATTFEDNIEHGN